jgi:hypothetical protein
MIFFQNCIRTACYVLIGLIVLLIIAAQFSAKASFFSISAKTEYFDGAIGNDGATFSARHARVCAVRESEEPSPSCGGKLVEIHPEFSGRITLPNNIRLRIRRGDGRFNQLFLLPQDGQPQRGRLESEDSGKVMYVDLPVRIDLPVVTTKAPMLINVAGYDATIGAVSTRDSSGLRNALREGVIEAYGIGLWWRVTGDPTAPVPPTQLFRIGAHELHLGDSVRMSTNDMSETGTPTSKTAFWATLGFDQDGVIEVSMRAVGDAAIVDRFGGAGLLVRKSWLDTLVGDPLFQLLWSFLGTLIALASIQFLGRTTTP